MLPAAIAGNTLSGKTTLQGAHLRLSKLKTFILYILYNIYISNVTFLFLVEVHDVKENIAQAVKIYGHDFQIVFST